MPLTVACQIPLSMEFSRQEYWSGLPSPALAGGFFTTQTSGKPKALFFSLSFPKPSTCPSQPQPQIVLAPDPPSPRSSLQRPKWLPIRSSEPAVAWPGAGNKVNEKDIVLPPPFTIQPGKRPVNKEQRWMQRPTLHSDPGAVMFTF